MASEAECHTALTAMFGTVPAGLAANEFTKGYLYQAVVFEAVGRALRHLAPTEWQWHNVGGVRRFAYTAGATIHAALNDLSCCSHANGIDHFVQGLTVRGISDVAHHLDATKIRTVGPAATWPNEPTGEWVRTTLECKNIEDSLSIDIGRELVGLQYDVIRPWHPEGPRLVLISSQGVSATTETLMNTHGAALHRHVHPANRGAWAGPLATYVHHI